MKKILCLIFMVFMVVGCSNSDGEASNVSSGVNSSSTGTVKENYEKKIVTSGAITADGELVVFAKNNSSVALDMEIEVEFYDSSNVIVGSEEEYIVSVGANAEVAIKTYDAPDSFDSYKIYVDAEKADDINYFDKIELTHNNNGDEILVQVKNNSNDEIETISVTVVYYLGDKVVGADSDSDYDIKPGRSANCTLYYPYDKRYKDVNFDNYKVFVNEAYSDEW